LDDGVRGDGVAKVRESLELLRTRCGVCGERLGEELQLEAQECDSRVLNRGSEGRG